MNSANIYPIFDKATSTMTYIVFDQPNGHAAIIDPVLDYEACSGTISTQSAKRVLQFIAENKLTVAWILETHAHADHLSAAHYLQEKVGGKIAIGERIHQIQQLFKDRFNLGPSFAADGSQFDHLFKDDEIFLIGKLNARAMFVPGHTPADVAYQIEDAIFVGDTLFMPDLGTARCDFPGGDARMMYRSIQKLLTFPNDTRLFVCHDYPPATRSVQWESTVAQQRKHNIHINDTISETDFVKLRKTRDATLTLPNLILPAIQINIRAGVLPQPENNGVVYLKIPINWKN